MNDCKFIELDDSLPNLLEEVGHEVDWESDKDRDRYYTFRNKVEQLLDKYYQGGTNAD
tara:strand:- start:988 stop:1161 length:174 start_codon:yes stop_codon:yes gene_type:complete